MSFDISTFMNRELTKQEVPSKKMVRNQSGRGGRRTYQTRQTLRAVGGYANSIQAVFAPPDQEMCVVVPMVTGFLPNGTPRREPRPGF